MAKKTHAKETKKKSAPAQQNASREEQVGFHKGSLMTLSKERTELMRILGIVEQLLQMHSTALKELGIPLDTMNAEQPATKKKPPIEDIL
jgi:hypothetical protein